MTWMIPILAFCLLTYLSHVFEGSFLSPGTFYSMCWTLFVIIPFIIAPDYPVYEEGLWVLFFFVALTVVGAITGRLAITEAEKRLLRQRVTYGEGEQPLLVDRRLVYIMGAL